jgi:hypothetical protein
MTSLICLPLRGQHRYFTGFPFHAPITSARTTNLLVEHKAKRAARIIARGMP